MNNSAHGTGLPTIGRALRVLRENTTSASDGRKLSQVDLYQRCREIENPPQGSRKGVCFASSNEKQQARIMHALENGGRKPTPMQLRYFEKALKLPSHALDLRFVSDEEILKLLNTPNASIRKFNNNSVPSVSNARISRDRMNTLNKLTDALSIDSIANFKIVTICGQAGIGKTSLINEWLLEYAGRINFTDKLILSCEDISWELVIQEFIRRLTGRAQERLSREVIAVLRQKEPLLVVIDGISIALSARVASIANDTHLHDAVFLDQLRSFLFVLAQHGLHMHVLIGAQTAEGRSDPLRLAHSVAPSSTYCEFHLQPLSPEQGKEMLVTLGVTAVSHDDLMHLSESLDGLPIAITAAAEYLRTLPAPQREDFILRISSRPNIDEKVGNFSKLIASLHKLRFDDGFHPLALLRLLAMMPGATPVAWIDALLQECSIVRLERFSLSELLSRAIPFITVIRDTINVHSLARAALLEDLKQLSSSDKGDPCVSRKELAEIHLAMAGICIRVLRNKTKEPTEHTIVALENSIYHLLRYREFVSECENDDFNFSCGDVTEKAIFDGNAGKRVITKFAWERIARPILNERTYYVTRAMGRYETKARILRYFFEDMDLDGEISYLSDHDAGEILKEISVCYMHAGRLKPAFLSIERAIHGYSRPSVDETFARFPTIESLMEAESAARERWLSHLDAAQQRALVTWRLARNAKSVRKQFAPYQGYAQKLLEEISNRDVDASDHAASRVIRILRRLVTRSGQITLYAGDVNEAYSRFELCTNIEKKLGGNYLTGDAARRQIHAIVRKFGRRPTAIAHCREILDYNLADLWKRTRDQRRRSNDIIAWRTCEAAVTRLNGDAAKAREIIDEILADDYFLRGEVPFYARAELEIEKARVSIECGIHGSSADDLLLLGQQLALRHHQYLFCEAELVRSEFVSPPDRESILDDMEALLSLYGWHLRRSDLEILRKADGSAVVEIGL